MVKRQVFNVDPKGGMNKSYLVRLFITIDLFENNEHAVEASWEPLNHLRLIFPMDGLEGIKVRAKHSNQ